MVVHQKNAEEFMDWIKALTAEGNIYIAGAGRYGKIIGKFLDEKQILWEGFTDKKTDLSDVNGKKVYSHSRSFTGQDYFIVSSYWYANEIAGNLMNGGVLERNIFIFPHIQDIVADMYQELVDWRNYAKKVQKFYRQYMGKRCFIIGNGPSLKISDLDRLTDEYTFACNSIYALYGSTMWRPKFYCVCDTIFCNKRMSDEEGIRNLLSGCDAGFTLIFREGFQFRDSEELRKLYYVRSLGEFDKDTGLPLFSSDCSEQVYSSGTVAYMMLQLAVYMGFQEIYLLGIDASYPVERHRDGTVEKWEVQAHQDMIQKEDQKFEQEEININGYQGLADIDWHMDGYRSARNYADAHGIKIYNATRGGKLEVFERVDFDSLF